MDATAVVAALVLVLVPAAVFGDCNSLSADCIAYDTNTFDKPLTQCSGSCGSAGSLGSWLNYFEMPTVPMTITSVCLRTYGVPDMWQIAWTSKGINVRFTIYEAVENSTYPVPGRILHSFISWVEFPKDQSNTIWDTNALSYINYHPHIFVGVTNVDTSTWMFYFRGSTTSNLHLGYSSGPNGWVSLKEQGVRTIAMRIAATPYTVAPSEMPAGWLCDRTWFKDNTTCHCNCGIPDPDCLNPLIGLKSPRCAPEDACHPATGRCVADGWNCGLGKYDDPSGVCDCACGNIRDPDCYEQPYPYLRCPNAVFPVCDLAANTCADLWTCDDAKYNDNRTCNCECGPIPDADCTKSPALPTDCTNGFTCLASQCKTYPVGWKCGATYNTGDVCNCGCDAYDPDCSRTPLLPTTCTGSKNMSCSLSGQCIAAACGNNFTDRVTGEECDGGAGCNATTCRCSRGYAPLPWPNSGCKPVCDGDKKPEEECDGTPFCDPEQCTCMPGFPPNPATGLCSGCGNWIKELEEQCETDGFGCSNCRCLRGFYASNDTTSINCVTECGDEITAGAEECDKTTFCNETTCRCEEGHPYNGASRMCSGCGNNIVDPGEECDGGSFCNSSCLCNSSSVKTPNGCVVRSSPRQDANKSSFSYSSGADAPPSSEGGNVQSVARIRWSSSKEHTKEPIGTTTVVIVVASCAGGLIIAAVILGVILLTRKKKVVHVPVAIPVTAFAVTSSGGDQMGACPPPSGQVEIDMVPVGGPATSGGMVLTSDFVRPTVSPVQSPGVSTAGGMILADSFAAKASVSSQSNLVSASARETSEVAYSVASTAAPEFVYDKYGNPVGVYADTIPQIGTNSK